MSSNDSLMTVEGIRNLVQDAHISFLLGSGISRPYLDTLNNLETLSNDVSEKNPTDNQRQKIQASLDHTYYTGISKKNLDILTNGEALKVLKEYEKFISAIHGILSNRANPLLPKQANLFTTNIDIFLENAFDRTNIELNDGFKGRLNPTFRLDNFRTRLFKLTLQYDNTAEVPVFNLFKLHGSLSWKLDKSEGNKRTISLDRSLEGVREIIKPADAAQRDVLSISKKTTAAQLIRAAGSDSASVSLKFFSEKYRTLMVVNPTKEKFETTVLQQTYYDLLRVFSNELEREASVLFVLGFSFADEHIRSLAVRAANSNPTLYIYVFCHSAGSKVEIEKEFAEDIFTYGNVMYVSPDDIPEKEKYGITEFDLETLTRVFFAPIGKSLDAESEEATTEEPSNEAR